MTRGERGGQRRGPAGGRRGLLPARGRGRMNAREKSPWPALPRPPLSPLAAPLLPSTYRIVILTRGVPVAFWGRGSRRRGSRRRRLRGKSRPHRPGECSGETLNLPDRTDNSSHQFASSRRERRTQPPAPPAPWMITRRSAQVGFRGSLSPLPPR